MPQQSSSSTSASKGKQSSQHPYLTESQSEKIESWNKDVPDRGKGTHSQSASGSSTASNDPTVQEYLKLKQDMYAKKK